MIVFKSYSNFKQEYKIIGLSNLYDIWDKKYETCFEFIEMKKRLSNSEFDILKSYKEKKSTNNLIQNGKIQFTLH